MGRYYNVNNMPGPGDFGHPDEWDDGRCEECGHEDCTKRCRCSTCGTMCEYCGHWMPDGEHSADWITDKGDASCERCWNDTFKTYWEEYERNHQ